MNISMMDVPVDDVKSLSQVDSPAVVENSENNNTEQAPVNNYTIDYSRYLGVLEIPKIGLKRGFYNTDSKYNDIKYNVSLVEGSTMPDAPNGNLMLMAHSGDSYISFFAYLYRLNVGDQVFVTYNGHRYQYNIVNIYDVPKTGIVKIVRNHDKNSLTMITCTKDNNYSQTVYISELVG